MQEHTSGDADNQVRSDCVTVLRRKMVTPSRITHQESERAAHSEEQQGVEDSKTKAQQLFVLVKRTTAQKGVRKRHGHGMTDR
jgi:hypothetical protein